MEPPCDPPTEPLGSPNQQNLLQNFWQSQLQAIEQGELDFKTFQLPLARIKKVMKTDEEVKMISAEAPIIFAKACEIFILELTLRSWIQTEDSKRRTLQRNDVASAIAKNDTFDFLIDIVPREESLRSGPKGDFRTMMGELNPFFFNPMGGGTGEPMGFPSNLPSNELVYLQQQQHQLQQQLQYLRQHQLVQNMQAGLDTMPLPENLISLEQQQQQQQQQHQQQQSIPSSQPNETKPDMTSFGNDLNPVVSEYKNGFKEATSQVS